MPKTPKRGGFVNKQAVSKLKERVQQQQQRRPDVQTIEQDLVQKGGLVWDPNQKQWFKNTASNRANIARRIQQLAGHDRANMFYNQITGKFQRATDANLKAYKDQLDKNIALEMFDLEGYRQSNKFNEMRYMRTQQPSNAAIAKLIEDQPDGSVHVNFPNHATLRMALSAFQGHWVR